jgi:hypothetical protein
MSEYQETYSRLMSLLQETLEASEKLKAFTRQNQDVLSGSDEKKIIEVLRHREKMLGDLINLEYGIERTLDALGLAVDSLPPDAEKLRSAIRATLDAVTETDVVSINCIRSHLQEYRDLTIRLRNKKHVSAYLKSARLSPRESSFDTIK